MMVNIPCQLDKIYNGHENTSVSVFMRWFSKKKVSPNRRDRVDVIIPGAEGEGVPV